MDELITIFPESEKEAIERFCSEYENEINTPNGFVVVCKYPVETAKHICGGKKRKFQSTRARYILWPKYIFLHPEERIVLQDNKTKNLIFFHEEKSIAYAVICRPLRGGKLDLISGFVVRGTRAVKYREGRPPYSFYKKKSC